MYVCMVRGGPDRGQKGIELDTHLSEVRDGSIQFQKDLLEEELAANEASLIQRGIQIAKRAG